MWIIAFALRNEKLLREFLPRRREGVPCFLYPGNPIAAGLYAEGLARQAFCRFTDRGKNLASDLLYTLLRTERVLASPPLSPSLKGYGLGGWSLGTL